MWIEQVDSCVDPWAGRSMQSGGGLPREDVIPRKCLAIALINPVVSETPGIPQTA